MGGGFFSPSETSDLDFTFQGTFYCKVTETGHFSPEATQLFPS